MSEHPESGISQSPEQKDTPTGTAILVDEEDSDRDRWHHSVVFDGYDMHLTAETSVK